MQEIGSVRSFFAAAYKARHLSCIPDFPLALKRDYFYPLDYIGT